MTIKQTGAKVENWVSAKKPGPEEIIGSFARLERLNSDKHVDDLFDANSADATIWDYLPYGPFLKKSDFRAWVKSVESQVDPYFYAVRNLETKRVCGVLSFLRIAPEMGSIEVGHINYSAELQRSRAATEAFYLTMKWAFEAGYRRFEWKCDANNIPSRRAAQRLGLSYEGIFRQAAIVKGRNRDTAWFAAIDKEWPRLNGAFQSWLSPSNFSDNGMQKDSLTSLTKDILVVVDPVL